MKYIVIGLGRFGSKLATVLTGMGNEVIGVDNSIERCDVVKDSIATSIRMDTTNAEAIKSLPLADVDAVIVAIGEDVGASVLTLSILKNLKAGRIIGRAVNQIHFNILNQIGIEEVVLPLEDSAEQLASMLKFRKTVRIYEIGNEFAVVELPVPEKYSGHTIDTINIRERFSLKLVAVKRAPGNDILSSLFRKNCNVELFSDETYVIQPADVLVIAGKIKDINRFIES